jgi:prolyl 4-hydroxylase
MMIAKGEDPLVDMVGKRMDVDLGLDENHAYHSQLLEYSEGEEYSPHKDCSNAENDRAGTALIYLTDVAEGGETAFPNLKLR